MIKISIEVKSGPTSYKVAVQAESIEGALTIVKRYNAGKWVWVCPVSADCLPLSHGASSQSNLFVL